MNQQRPDWHLSGLIWSFAIAGLLILSYLAPLTHPAWAALDTRVALALNSLVATSHPAQLLWAFGNRRVFDYISGAVLLMVVGHYVMAGTNAPRTTRIARMAISCVMLVALVALTRQFLFHDVSRNSPSIVLSHFTILSDHVTFHVKDHSGQSFPGDHATVLATFTFLLWAFAGWRYGLVSASLAALFALPRLVSGAHWLSDDIVGGVVTALVTVPIIVFTPCGNYLVNAVLQITPGRAHPTSLGR